MLILECFRIVNLIGAGGTELALALVMLKPMDLTLLDDPSTDPSGHDVIVGYVQEDWVRPDGTVERALFEVEGAECVLRYLGEYTWIELGDQIAVESRVGSYLVVGEKKATADDGEAIVFDLSAEIAECDLRLRVWSAG